ncbi:hypothetical protein [Streptomyces malaysiensis]|uniref:Uncharacterized protein n=1 Tax=Streptomyces malaysiensis TaxID=92644 RepID=A0A2J7Z364_STRMQ|nr:hypothetical protein [Streptomyces malaysiensis]PNG94723.1 hypothetical protein SMF913_10748 [Streptomyces malaysiensis]
MLSVRTDFERRFLFDEIDYDSDPDELKPRKTIEGIVRFNEVGST